MKERSAFSSKQTLLVTKLPGITAAADFSPLRINYSCVISLEIYSFAKIYTSSPPFSVSCNLLSLFYARFISQHLLLMRGARLQYCRLYLLLSIVVPPPPRHCRERDNESESVCGGAKGVYALSYIYTQRREISNKSARRLHQNTKNQTLAPHTQTHAGSGKTFCASVCAAGKGVVRYNLS